MDPKRLEVLPDADAAGRDSQIEALLVAGLDHYFARRYDDAIHLWTRVLFVDRSHARARAYIERARTALAERQRRAEELVATGHTLIDQGHTEAARGVLAEALAATGEDERASALRLRLERVERALAGPAAARSAGAAASPVPGWTEVRRRPARLGLAVAAIAGAALVALVTVPALQQFVGLPSPQTEFRLSAGVVSAPVLSSAEVALVRARTLYGRGRLAEALQALDRVGADSPSRSAADQLRIEIQRLLLASGREPSKPSTLSGSRMP